MSGGSMDYLYSKVADAIFDCSTPEREAFRVHLVRVAEALHAIEWVDSGDCEPGDENKAIIACLSGGAVLSAAVERAEKILQQLTAELKRAKNA